MKLFQCQACGQLLHFENTACERCGHRLGYLPDLGQLSALDRDGDLWQALAQPEKRYRFCVNAGYDACNWLVPSGAGESFCTACRHNRTIPDLSQNNNLMLWRNLEDAKHRLFYTLVRLHLPMPNRIDDPNEGLAFDFLADSGPDGPKVMTGHDNGVITIAVKEADRAERERMREFMNEPYRTALGHFRHEIGHYYWDRLVRDGGKLDAFRQRFGDERRDYGAALQAHYENGPPTNWQENFISAYATSHPWEDFAETWAHYLHIVDTLETAGSFGLSVHPPLDSHGALHAELDFDPYGTQDIREIIDAWLPLALAVNSVNRSMGQPDLYPFILSPTVVDKLGFMHRLVHLQPG